RFYVFIFKNENNLLKKLNLSSLKQKYFLQSHICSLEMSDFSFSRPRLFYQSHICSLKMFLIFKTENNLIKIKFIIFETKVFSIRAISAL
ncbi:hypothetical protein M153_41910001, partial [Pseudoloma neurophilia]